MIPVLALLPLAAAAAPPPALHVAPPRTLPARASLASVQAVFDRNAPLFDVALAHGFGRGLELVSHGLFHHQTIRGFGGVSRYDFDEFEGSLRWRAARLRGVDGHLLVSAGASRMYARLDLADGRSSFFFRRYGWGSLTSDARGPRGGRLRVALKALHERPTGDTIVAVVFALSPGDAERWRPIADVGAFVRNPGGWRAPWGAGVTRAFGRHRLTAYVSNTWGTTAPDSLFGTDELFYNARFAVLF